MTTRTVGPMEKRLTALGARIDRYASRKELAKVIGRGLDFARRGVDETQVQVALGTMDARDQLDEARERVRQALAALEHEVRALDDMPWDHLQDEIHIEAADVERELTTTG